MKEHLATIVSAIAIVVSLLSAGRIFFRTEVIVEHLQKEVQEAKAKQQNDLDRLEGRITSTIRDGFDSIRRELAITGALKKE